MRIVPLALGVFLASASTVQAQAAHAARLAWGPAPSVFPAGAQMAVVSGDPSKDGPFTVRLMFPNGYQIPPHSHPTAEHATVKSGVFLVGMGDTLDLAKTKKLTAGKEGEIPANMHHYAAAQGRTVVEIRSTGPFVMTYVNASDSAAAVARGRR